MRGTRRSLAALAVIILGCSDPTTAPELGEGTFLLRSVAGEPLPARVRVNSLFLGEYLADTLRFEPLSLAIFSGPTIERSIVERLPGEDPGLRIEFVQYDRDGNDFTFSYPCGPDTADCMVGLASGTLDGDRLEIIAHPNSGLRSPLVYERLQ